MLKKISRKTTSASLSRAALVIALAFAWPLSAWSGVSYSLDRHHAAAGETIHVNALVFNDTPTLLDWTAPDTIVLQWRSEHGEPLRSIAYLTTGTPAASVPVNNFARFQWRAVVPQVPSACKR